MLPATIVLPRTACTVTAYFCSILLSFKLIICCRTLRFLHVTRRRLPFLLRQLVLPELRPSASTDLPTSVSNSSSETGLQLLSKLGQPLLLYPRAFVRLLTPLFNPHFWKFWYFGDTYTHT